MDVFQAAIGGSAFMRRWSEMRAARRCRIIGVGKIGSGLNRECETDIAYQPVVKVDNR
jgi:hypothetical protein